MTALTAVGFGVRERLEACRISGLATEEQRLRAQWVTATASATFAVLHGLIGA
jgi:hypothetical protein